VVNAKTGRVKATIPAPGKGLRWWAAAPTGSGTTFVLAATGEGVTICARTYLYRLTLSASGTLVSVRPWTVPVVDQAIGDLTASADGGTIAYTGNCYHGHPAAVVGVIRGHSVKTWSTGPGSVMDPTPPAVSLSANGSLLAYVVERAGSRTTVRLLDTRSTAAGKVAYTYPLDTIPDEVVLSPDGTTAYLLWTQDGHSDLTAYRIGSRTTLFRDSLPTERYLLLTGSRLVTWWGGPSVLLVNPANGQVTRFRPPWSLNLTSAW
jgi:hypothetical protein